MTGSWAGAGRGGGAMTSFSMMLTLPPWVQGLGAKALRPGHCSPFLKFEFFVDTFPNPCGLFKLHN